MGWRLRAAAGIATDQSGSALRPRRAGGILRATGGTRTDLAEGGPEVPGDSRLASESGTLRREAMDEQALDPRPMMRIAAAVPDEGLRLRVQFHNGVCKTVDLAPLLRPRGPMVAPLLDDPAFFRAVGVADGTVVWPNGFDLDPDVLYYHDLAPEPVADDLALSRTAGACPGSRGR